MKVIDEEKRCTGRTLRLIFRALSYAGERERVQVILADGHTARIYSDLMIRIAHEYHFPDTAKAKDGPTTFEVSGTIYEFMSLSQFAKPGYLWNHQERATVLFDHWALEQMEEGRKKPS